MKAIRTGGGRVASGAASDEEAGERDQGFTLIEMMVVLLIMAILLAVAIPTFLGTTKTADDRQAESNVTNALIAAKSIYVQQNGYPKTATMVTTLTSQEPELKYANGTSSAGDSSGATKISVYTNGSSTTLGTKLVLADWSSQSQVCWVIKDLQAKTTHTSLTPGDWYAYGVFTAATSCYAASFKTAKPVSTVTGANTPSAWASTYPPLTTGH